MGGEFSAQRKRRRRRLDAALRNYEPGKEDEVDEDGWELFAEMREEGSFGESVAVSSHKVLVGGDRVWEYNLDGTLLRQWDRPGMVAASGNTTAVCFDDETLASDVVVGGGNCFDLEATSASAIFSTRSAVFVDEIVVQNIGNASVAIDGDSMLIGGRGFAALSIRGGEWKTLTQESDDAFGRLVAHRGGRSMIAGKDKVYIYEEDSFVARKNMVASSLSMEDDSSAATSEDLVTVYNSDWEESARLTVQGAKDVDLFGRRTMVVGAPSLASVSVFRRSDSSSEGGSSKSGGYDVVSHGVIPVVFTMLTLTCAISLLRLMRIPGLFFKRKFTPCAECRMVDGTYEDNIPHTHLVEIVEMDAEQDSSRNRARLPTAVSLPPSE